MEKININDIKPAKYNPRIISDEDYAKLQKSIATFGLVDPIIINLKNNIIIGGHQRYKALQDENIKDLQLLKMGDIGYVFHETNFKVPDEIHEKGLNLALNKITGEFVEEKLQPLLKELDLSGLDLEVTGFDKLEVDLPKDNILDKVMEKNDEDMTQEYKDYQERRNTINTKYETESSKTNAITDDYLISPFSVLNTHTKFWKVNTKALKLKIGEYTETREDTQSELGGSLYDPLLAYFLMKWFLPTNTNKKLNIIDPFAGDTVKSWIADRIGAHYTGIELRKEQYEHNLELCEKNNIDATYILDNGINVLNHVKKNSQDLIFSCPPYYNLEVYSNLEEDASNQKTYEDFLEIMREAFTGACETLKKNRFAVITLANVRDRAGIYHDINTDIKNIFRENVLGYYNEIIYPNQLGNAIRRIRKSMKNRKIITTHQTVHVFYKGNSSKISEHFGEVENNLFDILLE